MGSKKRKIAEIASLEIPPPTQHEIRFAILYGFRRQLKPVQIFNEFQNVYGVNAPSLVTVSKWYRRFQIGQFSVEDDPREGRPKSSTDKINVALVKALIDQDPKSTQKMIANRLNLDTMTVSRILNIHLGYTKKSDQWVPRNDENVPT